MINEELKIRRERLQYENNKLSSSLTLLAILFNAFYFISIYRTLYSTSMNYYNNIMIGVSIVYNLVFMLAAFLSSEGLKNYKKAFAYLIIVIGLIQLARIFIMPLNAFNTELTFSIPNSKDTYVATAMRAPQFIRVVIYLLISATLSITAGILGIIKSNQLRLSLAEKNGSVE